MIKRFWLPSALCFLFCHTLLGSTISTFEIVSANLGSTYGSFSYGGTYSGTFSFDTSLIPAQWTGSIPLASVDITTTPDIDSPQPLPGTQYSAGDIFASLQSLNGIPVDFYILNFFVTATGGDYEFSLEFLELPGTFVGGQIFKATETGFLTDTQRVDSSGQTLAIDPALVPEPASWTSYAFGSLVIAVALAFRKKPNIRRAEAARYCSHVS